MLHEVFSREFQHCRKTVVEMIMNSASADPSRCVVRSAGVNINALELIALAKKNACHLNNAGVMSGSYVLCSIDKDATLPIAWLSVMLAGGIFVPVDLKWPQDRLNYVAELTKAKILLTASLQVKARISGIKEMSIEMDTLETESALYPFGEVAPESLIYGFFTSGSTGTPKCALNYQAGVANRLQHMTQTFGTGNI